MKIAQIMRGFAVALLFCLTSPVFAAIQLTPVVTGLSSPTFVTNAGDGGDKYDWNTHWFSQHGYYVLTYTPRGFVDPGPDAPYQPLTPGGSSRN